MINKCLFFNYTCVYMKQIRRRSNKINWFLINKLIYRIVLFVLLLFKRKVDWDRFVYFNFFNQTIIYSRWVACNYFFLYWPFSLKSFLGSLSGSGTNRDQNGYGRKKLASKWNFYIKKCEIFWYKNYCKNIVPCICIPSGFRLVAFDFRSVAFFYVSIVDPQEA